MKLKFNLTFGRTKTVKETENYWVMTPSKKGVKATSVFLNGGIIGTISKRGDRPYMFIPALCGAFEFPRETTFLSANCAWGGNGITGKNCKEVRDKLVKFCKKAAACKI